MPATRRVGAETSKTRDHLLDCVERLMADEGYAAVSYRAVAARAAVTSGLVQYYFPSLDDLFLAAIRRRSQQNLDRLTQALQTRSNEPLRVLWEYSREESKSALTTEFLALGNHRKSIQREIAQVTEQVRRLQLATLKSAPPGRQLSLGELPADVLLFLLTGVPKLIRLEEGVGVSGTHAQVVRAFEKYLDSAEPTARTRRSPSKSAKKRSPSRRVS